MSCRPPTRPNLPRQAPPQVDGARRGHRRSSLSQLEPCGSAPPGPGEIIPVLVRPSASVDYDAKRNGLSKADLHVFSKLFDDGLERGQEAEAFSWRQIGGHDDVLEFLVGHLINVEMTRQPAP